MFSKHFANKNQLHGFYKQWNIGQKWVKVVTDLPSSFMFLDQRQTIVLRFIKTHVLICRTPLLVLGQWPLRKIAPTPKLILSQTPTLTGGGNCQDTTSSTACGVIVVNMKNQRTDLSRTLENKPCLTFRPSGHQGKQIHNNNEMIHEPYNEQYVRPTQTTL